MSARASRIFLCFLLWDSLGVSYTDRNNGSDYLAKKQLDYSREEILELLFLNSSYNSAIPPSRFLGEATTVYVQVYIASFDKINEQSHDYAINLNLRQQWVDPRLDFTNYSKTQKLKLTSRVLSKAWLPDTYFVNENEGRFHSVTAPNRMMLLFRDGAVFYSVRLSLLLACHMSLRNYPLDKQECQIQIASYAYSTVDLLYKWTEASPIIYDKDLTTVHYKLADHKFGDCTQNYIEFGIFSCIKTDFILERDFGFYIIQVYVPSILIVILSWVSFWLDVEAIPARITLGVLSVLTMTAQSTQEQGSLPRVGYIKSIDVWMAACLLFVFAALLEYAYINVLIRPQDRYLRFSKPPLPNGEDVYIKLNNNFKRKESESFSCSGLEGAKTVDRVARVLFPTAFLFFNMIYWMVYTLVDFK